MISAEAHLIDGGGGFRNAGGLDLGVLHDVLHVNAHLVHGAGDFLNRGGSLHTDFGGFIGGSGDLIGAGGYLTGGITGGADQILKTVGHSQESIAERVALRAGHDLDGEIAFGDGHGNAGHLLEVGDHVVERGGQGADFVGPMDINVLVEVTGIANLTCDGHEVRQRLGNRAGRVESDDDANQKCEKSAADSHEGADDAGTAC